MARPPVDLRLGCAPDIPLVRLHTFLGALYSFDPAGQVEVFHLRSADQLARLAAGDLDAGLLHDPGRPGVELTRLFPGERLGAVAPRPHLRDAPPPPPLARRTLRVFPRAVDPELHDQLLAAIEAAGHRFGRVVETGGADLRDVLLSVAEGGGVGLAPPSTLAVAGELGALVACELLDPPVRMPPTVIAWGARPAPELTDQLAAARRAAAELGADWSAG